MGWIRNMTAGLVGSLALNVLHEVLRKKLRNAPQINLLGEEALNKILGEFGGRITSPAILHKTTLEADLISNAVYYSLIGSRGKHIWFNAIVLGLTAGIGAIKLPQPLGLNPKPVTRTKQTEILTVGYYLFGALVTALVLKKFSSKG